MEEIVVAILAISGVCFIIDVFIDFVKEMLK